MNKSFRTKKRINNELIEKITIIEKKQPKCNKTYFFRYKIRLIVGKGALMVKEEGKRRKGGRERLLV